jgi:hypothetical protein
MRKEILVVMAGPVPAIHVLQYTFVYVPYGAARQRRLFSQSKKERNVLTEAEDAVGV